jgi:hypothetical protein
VAIYKFEKPIQRPSIGRYAMLRMAIRLNARHVLCCEQTASLPYLSLNLIIEYVGK